MDMMVGDIQTVSATLYDANDGPLNITSWSWTQDGGLLQFLDDPSQRTMRVKAVNPGLGSLNVMAGTIKQSIPVYVSAFGNPADHLVINQPAYRTT